MNLDQLIGTLRADPEFMGNVAHWETIPPKQAEYAPFPDGTDPRLIEVLRNRGIYQLYSHQRQAIDLASEGKDICVVTPTASGKTMCYNLPVLGEIMKNPDARALYLFPTKALSADQVAELYELIEAMARGENRVWTREDMEKGNEVIRLAVNRFIDKYEPKH